jgi:hypothetical protein
MEAASLPETLRILHISTSCHIPRDLNIQPFTKHMASHTRGKEYKNLMFCSYANWATDNTDYSFSMMDVPYSLPPYHLPELTFHGRTEKCWPIICTSFSSEKGKIIPQVVLNFRREM